MKKGSAGRDNVMVLTVIAIVTMVVVVIGATYAYLASSVGAGDQSNINASTQGSSDLLLFNAGDDISIVANDDNFGDGDGNLVGSANASVLLKTTAEDDVTYNYNVTLTVSHNDFEYSSGTCYVKSEAVAGNATNADECADLSATNIWATTNGNGYACYNPSTNVANAFYTNEVACLTSPYYMWSKDEVAELVFDLYQSNDETQQGTCEAAGVCLTKNRTVVEGATSEEDCASGNTWVPNIYDGGVCYAPIKHADVTELTTPEGINLSLLQNVAITASNGEVAHQYKAVVTLINFGHNQIINGNKSFNAKLDFTRITE